MQELLFFIRYTIQTISIFVLLGLILKYEFQINSVYIFTDFSWICKKLNSTLIFSWNKPTTMALRYEWLLKSNSKKVKQLCSRSRYWNIQRIVSERNKISKYTRFCSIWVNEYKPKFAHNRFFGVRLTKLQTQIQFF